MAHFKILIEYEGTRYSGWQVQKNARTVQGEIMNSLHTVFPKEQIDFAGSGRTDAGVHALMQAAHLDVKTVLAPEIIRMKVNDLLPADINILDVLKAPPRFNARHDAVARSYLYQISRRRTAFGKRFVWWVKDSLDVERMRKAAGVFRGMNDFRSFTADDPDEKSTRVLLDEVAIREAGDLILIRFLGSHFLWKMVRQLVGILAESGRGTMPPEQIRAMLDGHSDVPAQYTAPPSGLFLERVYYPGEEFLPEPVPVMEIAAFRAGRSAG